MNSIYLLQLHLGSAVIKGLKHHQTDFVGSEVRLQPWERACTTLIFTIPPSKRTSEAIGTCHRNMIQYDCLACVFGRYFGINSSFFMCILRPWTNEPPTAQNEEKHWFETFISSKQIPSLTLTNKNPY